MTLDFLPEKLWKGTVDYIYPSLDNKNRTLRARLRFDNKELLLRPNMFAQIIIHSNDKTNRLTIPREALIRTGKQDRVVLALGNGRFKSVAVKVGLITDDKVEIVKGLSADEKIVSSAQFLLDSESSKTSDFVRMSHPLTDNTDLPSATVIGVINTIDHKTRMANISRGPIEKWNREAAIVDFSVSTDLNIKDLNEGDNIEFTFVVLDGDFVVTEATVLEKASRKQAEPDHSDIDHSKMDHSTMEHN
jgi:Cu(I)/Ag(I) efflux system membrane fusion protein